MQPCVCENCDNEDETTDMRLKITRACGEFRDEQSALVKTLCLSRLAHERLGALHRLARLLEAHDELFVMLRHSRCASEAYAEVRRCRDAVENARIALFVHTTANLLLPDDGVSEDVCFFITMSACERVLAFSAKEMSHAAGHATPRAVVAMGCVPFDGVPVVRFSPFHLGCSISCVVEHRQSLDWRDGALHSYITALQRRASVLVGAHMHGEGELASFRERAAQWSCAIAVLKNSALHAMQCSAPQTASSPGNFRAWLASTVTKWDGPRLRESIAMAYRRRTIRIDEVGRNRAFGGQSVLHRARGAMDVTEELIHSIDLAAIVSLPEPDCVSVIRTLQDLVVLKVFTNCLELEQVDFASNHVVLDSLREMWATDTFSSQIQAKPTHICETMGGFSVRDGTNRAAEFVSFSAAAASWYDTYTPDSDPLKIRAAHLQ